MAVKLFGRTKQLENEITRFLDTLGDANLTYSGAIATYLQEGRTEGFTDKLRAVGDLESDADDLRRKILSDMYSEMLMPDVRGDVLNLLESLDGIINKYEEVLWYFEIETPDIGEEFRPGFLKLNDISTSSVESLVLAARAFFRDAPAIHDHMHKVLFHEKEGDEEVTRLRKQIFASDLSLMNKIHLRFFAERIVWIADMAEDIADELAIYAIKRTA